MTLRARLLLVLVCVVAAGLVISDVVTYTQLRSFLLARLDPQLQLASFSMTRALEADNGLGPGLPFLTGPGFGTGTDRRAGTFPGEQTGSVNGAPNHFGGFGATNHGGAGAGGTVTAAGAPPATTPTFPPGIERTLGRGRLPGAASGLEPSGTYGALVEANGHLYGKSVSVIYAGSAPPAPKLPSPLPSVTANGTAIFSAVSSSGGVGYRVLVRPLHYRSIDVVVAIPLSDVNGTLHRLLLVEIFVSLAVLLGLGFFAWWIVRRDLRPLESMATTAGQIAEGDLSRRVTPADDRTEVGRLGLALNAMLGEIEEAFAARAASEGRLRRFLADASHELRTPLTSIRGYAELFTLGASERPADLATSMRHIREEADRMNVLVDDLLLLARLDQERPLAVADCDLVELVQKAAAAARLGTPEHEVVIEAPPALVIACDAHRMRQVVGNLLDNALRHSPSGAPVRVTLSAGGGWATLEVSDRGPGVPPSEVPKIFEPFFRADESRARTTGGAGLGLAIVAAIARAHGGQVGVRPTEGGGATFWVRVPAGISSGNGQVGASIHTATIG